MSIIAACDQHAERLTEIKLIAQHPQDEFTLTASENKRHQDELRDLTNLFITSISTYVAFEAVFALFSSIFILCYPQLGMRVPFVVALLGSVVFGVLFVRARVHDLVFDGRDFVSSQS